MGPIIALVGWIVSAVGAIWIIVLAFKKHVGWGLGCIFLPILQLVFALMNLKEGAAKPLIIAVIGGVLVGVGVALTPAVPVDADGNPIMPPTMIEEPMEHPTPAAP